MLKTSSVPNIEKEHDAFPRLMTSDNGKSVVLITKLRDGKYSGMIIQGDPHAVGYVSDFFTNLKPYRGTVTLTQD